ncbi:MAG: hypothetical protein LLG14_01545 [Nocardiaceae bacterium]|nr:hypothetical protein [Nocardiaceae bacterium]
MEPEDWVPAACTLPTVEQPVRVAEFDDFFAESVVEARRLSDVRLDLALAPGAEPRARALAEKESGCCSFFDFAFGEVGALFDGIESDTVMQIEVSPSYVDVLDALAGRVDAALSRRRWA